MFVGTFYSDLRETAAMPCAFLASMDQPLDCLIIGGGPAGLTAAIYCARFLLTTLVVDAGGGRARMIPRTHNHAGFPGGIAGLELVERIAAQAIENGARIERGLIDTLIGKEGLFEARSGSAAHRARTVIIATGITDKRPAMPDTLHDAAVAASLLRYCPICDGFEMIDKKVAVIGTGEHGAREADFLRSYTRHVLLIAPEGPHQLSREQRSALSAAGVVLIDGPVFDFAIKDNRLRFTAGSLRVDVDACYPALGANIHSDLARKLGADARNGGCLLVDDHARTSVPGLYAAGDVVLGLDQISGAMGQAALAATTIRNDLSAESRRWR
jgi:thioredoxin reductase (NADPH)